MNILLMISIESDFLHIVVLFQLESVNGVINRIGSTGTNASRYGHIIRVHQRIILHRTLTLSRVHVYHLLYLLSVQIINHIGLELIVRYTLLSPTFGSLELLIQTIYFSLLRSHFFKNLHQYWLVRIFILI